MNQCIVSKIFFNLAVFSLLVSTDSVCGLRIRDIDKETISWRNELQKVYARTFSQSYKRKQIFTYFKSSCTGEEEGLHLTCVREAAAKRGLGSTISRSTLLKDVCCFFWDTFECSELMECKPLWKEMYEYYIEDRIKEHCQPVAGNWLQCEVPEDRPRRNKPNQYHDDSLPKKPLFYGVRQNLVNWYRQVTTTNKL